jgi:hypothetical protein
VTGAERRQEAAAEGHVTGRIAARIWKPT